MILGREPALWASVLRAAIAFVSAFFFTLSVDQQGALNAVVAVGLGIVVAWQVRAEKALPLLVGMAEALIYLAASFGYGLSPDRQATLVALVAVAVAFLTRDRVTAPVDASGVKQ